MSKIVEESSLVCKEKGWCVTEFQTKEFSFLWTIKNFSKCHKEVGEEIQSSIFTVDCQNCETKWKLCLYPNGYKKDNKDSLSVFLYPQNACAQPELFVNFQLSIVNAKGENTNVLNDDHDFGGGKLSGTTCLIERDELMEKSKELLPGDNLTLRCDLSIKTNIQTSSSGQNNHFYLKGEDKLSEDLRSVLDSDVMSDVTLVVEGREFHAHKIILSARSAVFSAMFQSAMKESVENKVTIDDIKADVFNIVLEYMYTGKASRLMSGKTQQNIDLLYAADKYALDHLKTICEVQLADAISVENAVQLLTVADANIANLLKECTARYICLHLAEETKTEEWKLLVDNHPKLELEILRASTTNRFRATSNETK